MEKQNNISLDELLDRIQVVPMSDLSTEYVPKFQGTCMDNWHGVTSDFHGGVVAYFLDESAAFHHRLTLINNLLNRLA